LRLASFCLLILLRIRKVNKILLGKLLRSPYFWALKNNKSFNQSSNQKSSYEAR
jgi:hypothetical protein